MEWTVNIEVTGRQPVTDAQTDRLVELLGSHAAAISVATDHHQWGAVLTVAAESALDAAHRGHDAFMGAADLAGCPEREPGVLEVVEVTEHDRRLAEPAYPELVGVAEIAELLGVSRQRASELQSRSGFPRPLQVLRAGPVWPKPWIVRFVEDWRRVGGRPPRRPANPSTTPASTGATVAGIPDSQQGWSAAGGKER